MRLRKWLVRGVVFTALLGMAGAAWVYQHWTDPSTVRLQVVAALEQQFPGADVTLEAARLRLLGGILLNDLRLMRRDDLTRTDFTYVPSAVVYHDKEQLLEGVLALRKVELHRPRLRVVREPDGRWNLSGLTDTAGTGKLLPTVVVHEGTILFEDRTADVSLLEITGVKMTLLNDPANAVNVEGSGVSAQLGAVELRGTWWRDTGRVALSVQAAGAAVTTELVRRLAHAVPRDYLKDLEVKAVADFQLEFEYRPDYDEPCKYDVHCRLRQGSCRHPLLPLPIENLQVEARCRDGLLTVEKATATSGGTRLEASATTLLKDWQSELEATLTVEDLPVSGELCKRLPADVQNLHRLFKPAGPVALRAELRTHEGRWLKKRCLLRPQNVEICFQYFPYLVSGVTGTLDADLLANTVKVNLASTTQAVTLNGTWQGSGDDAQVDLHLRADDIPLDDRLMRALPVEQEALARSFHVKGWGDLSAHIHHAPGTKGFCNNYQVRFQDASVCWDQFKYLLEKITGTLNIYPDHYEFVDLRGEHRDGVVWVSGRSIPWHQGEKADSSRLLLDIRGQDIGIDADLRKALDGLPNLARAWDTMAPAGRLNFHSRIDQIPERPQDLEIAVQVQGCKIEPVFFRYPLADLSGFFRYRHNRLEVQNVQAKHQNTRIAIGKGTVDLSPQGGFYANLENLQGNPIYPGDGLIEALPPSVQRVFTALNLKGPLAVQTQLVIAQSDEPGSRPDVYWKGRGWLDNTTLQAGVELSGVTGVVGCVGRHDGENFHGLSGNIVLTRATLFNQPLTDIHCNLAIKKETPDVLLLNVKAPLYGGDLSGEARLDLNSALRYEVNLFASQVDVKQFGQHNLKGRNDLKGKASARLHLSGQGAGVNTMTGNGTIHIPRGNLYNLPFLLDLLKFLGLRWPDRTAFEEAFASYSIHGNRLTINQLNLWGSAISLTGQGDVNLDGTDVKLDFYPTWGRVEQLLPPVLKNMTPTVSKSLMKIEVRGHIGPNPDDLKFHKRPVPVLVDPLLQLRDRVTGVQKDRLKSEAGKDR